MHAHVTHINIHAQTHTLHVYTLTHTTHAYTTHTQHTTHTHTTYNTNTHSHIHNIQHTHTFTCTHKTHYYTTWWYGVMYSCLDDGIQSAMELHSVIRLHAVYNLLSLYMNCDSANGHCCELLKCKSHPLTMQWIPQRRCIRIIDTSKPIVIYANNKTRSYIMNFCWSCLSYKLDQSCEPKQFAITI